MKRNNKFSFRMGATSYVIAGDIFANVNYLSQKVDDIELVIFESDALCPLPDVATILSLRQIALRNDLTFTIHLPLDIWIGDQNEAERHNSVGKCLRVMERMRPLLPFGFVLHCNRKPKDASTQSGDACWQMNIEKSIDELLLSGIPSAMLCIETLDYPFALVEPIIHKKKLGICLDIGHILLNDFSLDDYLHRYFDETRIVHLHGVNEGRDHCDISAMHPQHLSMVLQRLKPHQALRRVVTLEVFNEADLNASLSVMEHWKP